MLNEDFAHVRRGSKFRHKKVHQSISLTQRMEQQAWRTAQQQIQRLFTFITQVHSGPRDSIYQYTKVLTIKSKYLVENQTGMSFKIMQSGTPRVLNNMTYGEHARNTVENLPHGETAALYWDNAQLQPSISIQPVVEN